MENIANFLTAAEKYGCNRGDLFQSVYLQDGQNMPAVVGGIHALGRRVRFFFDNDFVFHILREKKF